MKRIPLTQGKIALVDDEDFERVNQYKWCSCWHYNNWRAMRSVRRVDGKRKTQYLHRFILNVPDGLSIDHRNHNGLDNRKSNLRICTNAQNNMNRKLQKGTSKYKGVSWDKHSKKWVAYIHINNKHIHLGSYTNEITAALVYNIKAKELFGKFAYLNF